MSDNLINTVRIFVKNQFGEVLLLRKSPESKNPFKYELPGGKVEDSFTNFESAQKELFEETGINISIDQLEFLDKLSGFAYNFIHMGKQHNRLVDYFLCEVNIDKEEFEANWEKVSQNSYSEDKHIGYLWVNKEMLDELTEEFADNSAVALYKFFDV